MSLQPPVTEPAPEQPRDLTASDAVGELTPHAGYRAVLQNKNFLALWIGQIFSQIADRIIFVVFISLIVQHFGPGDRYSSFLYIAFTIPAILLTAIAGVFVDRWPRRAVLVSTNLMRAAIVAFIPWAASVSGGWALYALAFLISVATQFFVPAEAATIPMIVNRSSLLTANSLFTTTMMASVIFGFALGDPLINIFSLQNVHWAITGLFLLASASLALVQPALACSLGEKPSKPKTVGEGIRAFFAEIQDGLHYIRDDALVRNAMLKLATLFSAIVALCILFISFAKTYLYDNPQVAAQKFAYIIAMCGVGMAVGAFWVGHAFHNARRGIMVFSGFIVIGLCLLLLTLTGKIPAQDHVFHLPQMASQFVYLDEVRFTMRMLYTYTLSVIMGAGGAFVAIPLQAVVHELIPEDKRGKVLGVQFTVLSTSSTLPVLIAGLAVEQLGVQAMFLLIGIPVLLLGTIGLYRRLKADKNHVFVANW
ncbi:MAG TPA: MFS transporter [Oculatellaceae cyanobacterium]|jgi:MFS family permease